MADYIIPITTKKFNFLEMFGSVELDVLPSEKIFYSYGETDTVRTVDESFVISSGTHEIDQDIVEFAYGSGAFTLEKFRLNERIKVLNSSGNAVAYGVVVSKHLTLKIRVSSHTDIASSYQIDMVADNYFNEERSTEFSTRKVGFLMLASSTGGTLDINDITLLKKKS